VVAVAAAAGGGDGKGTGTGTGGAALRPDAGGSGSTDDDSRASMARPLAGALPVGQESAELKVLKAIEELAIEALS